MGDLYLTVCDNLEPHLHAVTVRNIDLAWLFYVDGRLVGDFAPKEKAIADRVVELVKAHGLADVPDSPAELASPWPPPAPKAGE